MRTTPSSPIADRRFVFFGGKGGAGKSTCAAAAALAVPGDDVLALSLDPAHSLKDVLGDAPGVAVLELDAGEELGRFMREHRGELRVIADRGTYFDDEDIDGFLDLSLPGLDEIMGLLKLGELARENRPRRVVVDLPPTGHALRLFNVSAAFDHLVGALELMQDKHRFAVTSLTRRYSRDAIDGFLEDLRASCQAARDTLLEPGTSAFVLIARPEPMVLAETVRLAASLTAIGATPAALVLNGAADGAAPLPPELGGLPQARLPWLDKPPVGAQGLRPVVAALAPLLGVAVGHSGTPPVPMANGPHLEVRPKSTRREVNPAAIVAGAGPAGSIAPLLRAPRRLTIFGGKGGVGKTTLAAATALALARQQPERSVVVVSIDPAHSLGDSLGQPLAGVPRAVRGQANLRATELDPEEHWREFRENWEAEGEQLFDGLSGSGRLDPVYDRQIAAQLGKIEPTGLDELQAATSVIDLLDEDPARLVVVDSAPTGHLLRFLESPRLVVDWARELMRILLKYGLATQVKRLSEDLLDLSRKTKRLDALLHDPELCELVVVALAEAPVLAETERLIERLREMRVEVRHVILNQMAGRTELATAFEQRHPELGFVEIARCAEPVQGIEALRKLAA
jgi:arsenite/tail-anchored protein-transporting ATPase